MMGGAVIIIVVLVVSTIIVIIGKCTISVFKTQSSFACVLTPLTIIGRSWHLNIRYIEIVISTLHLDFRSDNKLLNHAVFLLFKCPITIIFSSMCIYTNSTTRILINLSLMHHILKLSGPFLLLLLLLLFIILSLLDSLCTHQPLSYSNYSL